MEHCQVHWYFPNSLDISCNKDKNPCLHVCCVGVLPHIPQNAVSTRNDTNTLTAL